MKAWVRSLWPEGRLLTGARLDVPEPVRARHRAPGQYLVLPGRDGRGLTLALASVPGAAALELLLGPEAAERAGLRVDEALEIEGPSGPGFDLEAARGGDVLVFGTGSALSALKPLLDLIAADRQSFGQVRAYFGAVDEAAHAYRDQDPRWEAAGIRVRRSGARPWVQEVFLEDAEPLTPAQSYAFAAGLPVMLDGVKDALRARGIPAERLGLNFG
ncbi:MAG: hypothetical protein U1E65_32715 [Myxococcota bacterium]